MLNKELLMVGSESLEPVLSIYISPDLRHSASVSGKLSSGEYFYVSNAGETTFKFSEIKLTAIISITFYEDMHIYSSNLVSAYESYSGGVARAPAVITDSVRIRDSTQSAILSIT